MFAKLLALFILVPLAEVLLLIKMGEMVGFWPTVFIQVATGFVGASLARFQGFFVWRNVEAELAAGRIPTAQMVDGLLIFAAGLVLLTPGLITDALGLWVLVPWTRGLFRGWLKRRFENFIQKHAGGLSGFNRPPGNIFDVKGE